MDRTWIVVASRDEVRIFERVGTNPISLITDIGNPEGRWRAQDFVSDRAGASNDNRKPGRPCYSTEQSPKERSLVHFYDEISDQLDLALDKGRFERLIIVAEPRLLGILRSLMPTSLHRVIVQEIHKDLSFADVKQIEERL